MAGVMFVVCVPTRQYEINLTENSQGKSLSSNTISEHFIRQYPDKSESLPSLRKNISTTKESLCATDDTCISYVSRTPKAYSAATISTDDNLERSIFNNEARINKRSDRSYEVAVKPDGSRRFEDFMKKGGAETDAQTGHTMPMEKVRRNTVMIVY
jgi:hypothetical protein